MPIERADNTFKDISMTFQISPLNGDLVAIKNETAIARSIRNLVFTIVGERPYSDIGSDVKKLLFSNIDDITTNILRETITEVIKLYEPRVSLDNVNIEPDYDNYNYNITISYTIIGNETLTQQLNLVLETVR
jgi:phage baseplate assembly protein W